MWDENIVDPDITIVSNDVWSTASQSVCDAGDGAARGDDMSSSGCGSSVGVHRIVPPGKSFGVSGTVALRRARDALAQSVMDSKSLWSSMCCPS
mmetsp:Transcript_98144/g.136336  ORF Transcript_98144/g.136336 Transcript_98144/m.136336 type:complete len:94 (-) Transcript_98144:99-380(-)